MAPHLDPINQAAVDEIAAEGIPPLEDLSVPQLRKFLDQISQQTPLSGVTRTHFEVPFKDRHVKAFLFKPEGAEGLLPTIEYLHGGGWIAGDVDDFDNFCRDLVLRTGFAVVYVEYSLAPERKFPTQQEECFTVAEYINKHGARLGLKADKIAFVGDSAGGQLVAAISLLTQKRKPKFKMAHQVLICPAVDLNFQRETKSEFEFFDGPFLDVPFMLKAANLYLPHGEDRKNPLVSPLLMTKEQAAKMPQSTVLVSSVDPLRSDGISFAELLQGSDVDTVIVRGEGLIHDAYVLEGTREDPTCRAVIGMVADRLKASLAPRSATATPTKRAAESKSETRKRARRT